VGLGFVLLASTAAALATPAGGLAALGVHRQTGEIGQTLLRTVVALGGGLLFAAIALVLLPEGLILLSTGPSVAWILAGAGLVLLLDRAIERKGGHAAQVMGSALDSVPESAGLGAAFAVGGHTGPVLVLLVALQNLPQGFNGFLELRGPHGRAGTAFGVLTWTSLLGPLAAALGYLYLGPYPDAVAALFLASAGGLLYLLVQDVAPLAHKDGHWVPALGAVLGFALGLVCNEVVR
jgi:ZIP family zinc transporter